MSETCDECGDETETPVYTPDGRVLCAACHFYEITKREMKGGEHANG